MYTTYSRPWSHDVILSPFHITLSSVFNSGTVYIMGCDSHPINYTGVHLKKEEGTVVRQRITQCISL